MEPNYINSSMERKFNLTEWLYVTFHETTRRPLSTGIFSATRLLQKKYGEGEVRTLDLQPD